MPTRLGTDYHPKMAAENVNLTQAIEQRSAQLGVLNQRLEALESNQARSENSMEGGNQSEPNQHQGRTDNH